MSETIILLTVLSYLCIVLVVIFGILGSSNSSARQIVAYALFWPIFGLIHLVIGFIENVKDLNK